jgi:hypothetical protein
MEIYSVWFDDLPDTVGSWIGTTASAAMIPRTTNHWRCHYAVSDSGDMEVIGFAAAGPKDGCINLVAEGVDNTVLTSLIAASFSSVPKSNLLVECIDDDAQSVLDFLKIDNRKKANASDRPERSDDERLHDDAGQVRSVPLARDEEGEDD